VRRRLRGLAWDHPRCTVPLLAASKLYSAIREVDVEWSVRPLAAFNDQPLAEITDSFDIVSIDHPLVGTGEEAQLLSPLDAFRSDIDLVSPKDAVGLAKSLASYNYRGRQWAMPTDATCQMSVWRPDLLASQGTTLPAEWEGVVDFCAMLPGRVVWPLFPTDAICSLLSIAASFGFLFDEEDPRLPLDTTAAAFDVMARCLPALHPMSLNSNPPRVLDALVSSTTLLYSPLTFGYATYADPRRDDHRLEFGAAPRGPAGSTSILGGAGLAVSAASRHEEDAESFVTWVSSTSTQVSLIGATVGQPGDEQAWRRLASRDPSGFFATTQQAMSDAFIRPRAAWWPRYQATAGEVVHRCLAEGGAPGTLALDLRELLHSLTNHGVR